MVDPPEGTKRCPDCGSWIGASRSYCTQCGAAQAGGDAVAGNDEARSAAGRESGEQPGGRRRAGRPTGPRQTGGGQNDTGSQLVTVIVVIGAVFFLAPVALALTLTLGAFLLDSGDTTDPVPQTSFRYDYDASTGVLNITVANGDSFRSDRVAFRGSGFGQAGETWGAQTEDGTTVADGDEITLANVEDDFELELVWESGDGESEVLSTRVGPAA